MLRSRALGGDDLGLDPAQIPGHGGAGRDGIVDLEAPFSDLGGADEAVFFTNVSEQAGIADFGGSYFAWGDYNDDGNQDLFGSAVRLYDRIRLDEERRGLVETAVSRFTSEFGGVLRSRTLPAQVTEIRIACSILNTMTKLGMPDGHCVS